MFYWASRLSLDSFSSFVLYLGYLLLLALFDFLVTGTSCIHCHMEGRALMVVKAPLDSSRRIGLFGAFIPRSASTEYRWLDVDGLYYMSRSWTKPGFAREINLVQN